jgi:hypothetical protein
MADLVEWLDSYTGPDFFCYAKRLSGNDTLANGAHQAGPYIPTEVLFAAVPLLYRPKTLNPDVRFSLYVDSHADHRTIRAIWYNNRLHPPGTRNEARLTGFGGGASALLDPESTGALAVFAFARDPDAPECHVWVCRNDVEEEVVEAHIGPVEPGKGTVWRTDHVKLLSRQVPRFGCRLERDEIPEAWLRSFPRGEAIVRKAVELRPHNELTPDYRLLKRRECEFEIFRAVEEAFELPDITAGFTGIDRFIEKAQTILQRRKARSGRSLELHTERIFIDAGLRKGIDFDQQKESEHGKTPDFLFPNAACYRDAAFPANCLRMLAVKTTCKDRWRQILNEADRIPQKHLLTLQEGISGNQFREMTAAGVQLVVPEPLIDKYPVDVKPHIQTLEGFMADLRRLSMS